MNPLHLAWSNLTQQPMRTLVSLIGVAFAVVLVFMQLGFLGAVINTATLLYDQLKFDLLLVSPEYITLNKASSFPRARLVQAKAARGVQAVLPLTATLGLWRDPRPVPPSIVGGTSSNRDAPRQHWSILVLGVDPGQLPLLFREPIGTVFRSQADLRHSAAVLARLGSVLIDETSREEYGNLETWKPGSFNELNNSRVQIAGLVRIGTGFAYNGLLITSEATLTRTRGWPADQVTFGLVQLSPETNPLEVQAELKRLLPDDVQILTRAEINQKEQTFWLTGTAVGQFFIAGVVIALLVGGIFVYQMMAADIARRLPEYATIRALGYPGSYLSKVVYAQGLLLALIGYLPGVIATLIFYDLTRRGAGIPIGMTGTRLVLVLVLTVGMCLGSAILAVRGVQRANPADLF